ncbi:MAG: glycoside hydrolase family 92 protein [Bacteroidia bacterium]|nr:glycoside hydrolase family 92 protein [Bacteroidia bacterium]
MTLRSLLLILLLFSGLLPAQTSPADLVYPALDAANSRWFFFASASRPFGMVNLSPDTDRFGSWGSGYRYNTPTVRCFSHIHAWQMSGISLMPLPFNEHISKYTSDYSSDFTHEKEVIQPGYHKLYLEKWGIGVELTSTPRVGFYRIQYPAINKGLLMDLGSRLGPSGMGYAEIKYLNNMEMCGQVTMKNTNRRPKPVTVYFHLQFDQGIHGMDVYRSSNYQEAKREVKGSNAGAYFHFPVGDPKVLRVKLAISYVSTEEAKKNMQTELPHWDFDRVVEESKAEWNDLLGRIEVEGGTETDRRRFYTDLWHALQGRRIVSDADGHYIDNTGKSPVARQLPLGPDGKPKFTHHNSDSFWGAQWTLNTLWHLAYPEVTSSFCNSLLTYYKDGGLIPRGPSGGNYTHVMTGASTTPFIVSAYMKGIRDFDIETAYAGLKKNHLPGGMMGKAGYEHESAKAGGIEFYLEKGYVPYPLERLNLAVHKQGAGQTLEYAYQDYCLAQLAKKLGKTADYDTFIKRSQNYRNLYDPETGYIRPKDEKGEWKDNFDPLQYKNGFVESNAAQATWFVPHDFAGLAELMGGREKLIERLDQAFREAEKEGFTAGDSHAEEEEKEARRIPINYGNQPSIHTAFIFNEVGAPWLTQYWSRKVVRSVWSGLSPETGYSGDEDQGLMGSLAVLYKIGLFQLDGGVTDDPVYQIGSPIFDKITLHLNSRYYPGGTFTIRVKNNSEKNIYIQSLTLNQKKLDRYFLYHSEITKGGELVLEMGSEPVK